MTSLKVNGATEKYDYGYCWCGALKSHEYTCQDSKSASQQMEWIRLRSLTRTSADWPDGIENKTDCERCL